MGGTFLHGIASPFLPAGFRAHQPPPPSPTCRQHPDDRAQLVQLKRAAQSQQRKGRRVLQLHESGMGGDRDVCMTSSWPISSHAREHVDCNDECVCSELS
jgi:hypothetical protein